LNANTLPDVAKKISAADAAQAKALFKILDGNGDGGISLKELQTVMQVLP
jgi:Ca2+-binding EF-hand superfamily protein